MRKLILVLLVSIAFAKEVSFTQEDRDRLIRLEVKVEALDKRMDILQKQIADLKTMGLWHPFQWHGHTIGLVMWDREATMSPVVEKTREIEDKSKRVEKALKERAKRKQKVEEFLRRAGLL